MKSKFICVIVCSFFMIATSCSSDDDGGGGADASLIPISIQFVNENGTPITSDCLDINENYAVQIETEMAGSGAIAATQIQYTLNGILYSMTFNQIGVQRQPVVLADGQNIAQLVTIGVADEIRFVIQDDFELVF
ncbi:hypothetical protein [Lacinutrix himadriensis]|uniref:hypothetical protein n=1 Tax=Lacinutrix himadriensis TaxID=641549 RepID=UPI000AC4550E|nr:hypothetical protein [Lacinutrix himadriensis]